MLRQLGRVLDEISLGIDGSAAAAAAAASAAGGGGGGGGGGGAAASRLILEQVRCFISVWEE